jgi:hypothetical protein
MSPAPSPHVRISAVLALLAISTEAAAAAHDPRLRFRSLAAEHFVIYYHQGEEHLARRLVAIAEDTWRRLAPPLGVTPPSRTHVVLVDEADDANGAASPLPYNTIIVTAAWPAGVDFLGNTEDWLRLVFTHEFAHIVHLDRSEGWARVFRGIFGRMPLAFPNLFLPVWQIEGLATYEESASTGEGRLNAGDFLAIVDEAARTRRLEPIDRVSGGLTDWPSGLAAYAYGGRFHAYLADRYGPTTLGALARATAGRFPYTGSRVFKQIYGKSLGELWHEYEAAVTAGAAPPGAGDQTKRLTQNGFVTAGPRFTPLKCRACPPEIVYSVRTPHGFPALLRRTLDGPSSEELATRFLGSTVGVGSEIIVFDQQELRRNAALYSDLYALDRSTGSVRQLTSEARLLDPDLSSDGKAIVAVRNRNGQRDLVTIDLNRNTTDGRDGTPVAVLASEPETQFNAPRWSPRGDSIVAERHQLGSRSEIIVIDRSGGPLRVIASDMSARIVTPTWRPDGAAILAAVSFADEPFNLYEFPLDGGPPRQLTRTTGGAIWPDVSPDGRTLVFVGYTPDGFDLFEAPYPNLSSEVVQRLNAPAADAAPAVSAPSAPARSAGYNPWLTLPPTSWSPVIELDSEELRLGASTSGQDVLGYHSYSISASWLVNAPINAVIPDRSVPDWRVAYVYDRWRPAFWATASSESTFFAGPAGDDGLPSTATERERQFETGVIFPIRHVRTSNAIRASMVWADDDFLSDAGTTSETRVAGRLAWVFNSALAYGYSVSPEDGATFGTTAEIVRRALGASGDATSFTVDGRVYIPSFAAHHVIAVRVAAGTAAGDPNVRRTFHLGGASPDLSPVDFGSGAMSLLRGFPADSFAGRNVVLLNGDYRWPIARPQRGHGTWPLMIHTVHGALFIDAGHAWNQSFHAKDLQTSFGGELSFDVVAGYFFRLTTTVGVAAGRGGYGPVRNGTTAYLRLGRAF